MKRLLFIITFFACFNTFAQNWELQSTANNQIPKVWSGTQQTAAMVLDLDKDGTQEFIMAQRTGSPSLVYLKYDRAIGWRDFVIDREILTIEAGGANYDIDKDGDLDLVFGGDWQSPQVWWWENPYPFFNPSVPWKRHLIKKEGKNQHHDQVFGDFKMTGRAQLAFWNQGAKKLMLATIPAKPTEELWPTEVIFEATGLTKNNYAEGCEAADVDGDGLKDLIAGNYWFKFTDGKFKATKFGEDGGRVVAAKFKVSKKQQLLVSPGDGKGRLMLYECTGSAEETANWKGRDLIGRELVHGHTLEVADINSDGNLDIFCAEMAKWSEKETKPDNPKAEAFILYGDGKGNFKKTVFKTGVGFHEGKLSDIDGDGDIDIISKPYNWEAPRLDVWLQNGTGPKKSKIADLYTSNKIGLELYSLRDYFKTDVPATLDYVKSLGIKEVELAGTYGYSAENFKKELDKRNLVPLSALLDFNDFKDSLPKLIKFAKTLGLKAIGTAWIPHKTNQFGQENADNAIKVFNNAATELKKQGIDFYYHCHGYEFKSMPDGSTIMDYILTKTNPNVLIEVDIYWAFHGGQDPALFIRKYGNRVFGLHLKDMVYGQATGELSGNTPLTSDVSLGTGQLNLKSVLDAALAAKVKYYFLEDENAEVKDHLPISLNYLKELK